MIARLIRRTVVTGVALAAVGSTAETRAAPPAELEPGVPPSPFETGLNGFGMGIAAGLAGGYLVARSGGFTSGDWRPLVAGAGIGALAGGTIGLTLGLVDSNSSSRGRGFLVMRDMAFGGWFGAVFGGVAGGLAALETNRLENVLFGAAIGTLAGTVLGLVYGSVERNPWSGGLGGRPRASSWNLGITPLLTTSGALSMGPSLSGRF